MSLLESATTLLLTQLILKESPMGLLVPTMTHLLSTMSFLESVTTLLLTQLMLKESIFSLLASTPVFLLSRLN